MALAINDTAPDFEAETTEGKIRFHDWIGNNWTVLFSHPKDFTPVCTTELGYMAKIKPEFDKRGVKIIGLSVDPLASHHGWSNDIKETQGFAPNYPMIADSDFNVSKLYGMLPAAVSDDHWPRLRRGVAGDRFAAAHRQAQGGDAGELEAGRGRDHRRFGQRRRGEEAISAGLEGAQALHPHRAATEGLTFICL